MSIFSIQDLSFRIGSEELRCMEKILREAGKALLREQKYEIMAKAAFDYVTQVDCSVQQKLQVDLGRAFPEVQFWGEEGTERPDLSRATWIVDPVDGTSNLIHHRRYSCISVAWVQNNQVQAGFIYDPYSGEFFHGSLGGGAYLGAKCLSMECFAGLEHTMLLCSSGSTNKERANLQMALLTQIQQKILDLRITGSSALNLAALAAGRGTGLISTCMKPWDLAAGLVLVRECGGVLTDYSGKACSGLETTSVVAAPKLLQTWLLEQIRGAGLDNHHLFQYKMNS